MREEKWVCIKCGEEAPCRLSIKFSDDKVPEYLKGRQRLTRDVCPCEAYPKADWVREE
jgi:hypothetical protein